MTSNGLTSRRVWQRSTSAGLAAAAAALIGMGTAHADTPDDAIGQALAAVGAVDPLSFTDLPSSTGL